jgi:hypothetical protein
MAWRLRESDTCNENTKAGAVSRLAGSNPTVAAHSKTEEEEKKRSLEDLLWYVALSASAGSETDHRATSKMLLLFQCPTTSFGPPLATFPHIATSLHACSCLLSGL